MASSYRVNCKMCRREGISVCGRAKCAAKRRQSPPGVHGPNGYGKMTPFAQQLREKQKVKRTYGMRERQFHHYYEEAIASKGNTGEILSQFLELRLDALLVRAGFALTHSQARQWVNHGHITVNGKRVDIPSYRLKVGEIVGIKRDGTGSLPKGVELVITTKKGKSPEWMVVDDTKWEVTIVRMPSAEELPSQFNMRSIVEFYSR